MAIYKHDSNSNGFLAFFRKFYNPIGFTKGYNFILFFILAGALFGFALARSPYMNVNGYFLSRAGPGEAYWYRQKYYNIGIHIHLIGVIPASLLVIWQFVPAIRYEVLLFHRINGYIVIFFLVVGNIGALMIARRAFGGSIATQTAVGTCAIFTTVGLFLAWTNIKRLQIDQHRAWMLRTWVVAGSIITERLIQVMAGQIISRVGSYHKEMLCAQIAGAGGDFEKYPTCQADPNGRAVVHAHWSDSTDGVEQVAAVFQLTFGGVLWLVFFIHLIAVETYLRLTKAEGERLRQVSYERQLERGLKNAGSGGWTSDKFGDEEEWKPKSASKLPANTSAQRKTEEGVLRDASSDLGKSASMLHQERR